MTWNTGILLRHQEDSQWGGQSAADQWGRPVALAFASRPAIGSGCESARYATAATARAEWARLFTVMQILAELSLVATGG